MALALYSDVFWFPSGNLAAGVPARIFQHGANVLVPLWQDAGGTVPAANPAVTSAAGVLTFWIEEGTYWLHLDTESFEITVPAGSGSGVTQQELADAVEPMGLDTGVLYGGELNANLLNPLSLDISLTVGFVIDYLTTPATPVITRVVVPAQTVALTDVVSVVTWWMADSSGNVIQQATRPTNTQRRTHLQLGATAQTGGAIFVDQSLPVVLPQPTNQLYDLMYALGAFNISGNTLAAGGANLTVAKSSGTVFTVGFNHFDGPTLTNDPHVSSVPAQNPTSMRYVTRTPAPLAPVVTNVDTANYDNAGVITPVGGGPNRSTIQRVYLFPVNDVADQVVVQYGQTVYATLADAVSAVGADTFVPNPTLTEGVLLGFIVATRTATDLSNVAQARIIMAGKFGSSPSGSVTAPAESWVFNVADAAYGALGNAQVVGDGAMGIGSAVLTSATAAFVAGDVGKAISVKGAAATGVTTLYTTILSRQSATQVTLNAVNASGGALTNSVVIWGTDDTAAVNAAVNAAEAYLAAGATYAQVFFPPRPYVIAGALNTSKSGNGQIVFGPQPTTAVKKILEFVGQSDGAAAVRHWQQLVPQFAGSCLISFGVYASVGAQIASINAAGNPGVICGPNEGSGYGVGAVYSNTQAVIKNLAILTGHSSFGLTYGAANLYGCANAHVENVGYGTAGTVAAPSTDYTSPGVFGTGLSFGFLMPAPGNNDYTWALNVSCGGGYTYAFALTEHGVMARYMALYCWAGLCAVGTYFGSVGSVHAMKVLSASIEACVNELYIIGPGSSGVGPIIDIDQLSTENSTPNISGNSTGAVAAALGRVKLTGLFTESGVSTSSPSGIELVNGQVPAPNKRKTANFTCSPIDRVLICDTTSAGFTATLPAADFNAVTYTFHNVGSNTLTVATGTAQVIVTAALPGATSVSVLTGTILRVTAMFDGSVWSWYAV